MERVKISKIQSLIKVFFPQSSNFWKDCMGTTYRNNLEGLPWEKRLPLLHETIFLLSNRPFLHVCACVWHRKIRQFWSIKEEVLPYCRYVARVYLIQWTLFERCKTTANDVRNTEKLNFPLTLNLQRSPAYTKQNGKRLGAHPQL